MGKARVHADARQHQTEAIRTLDAQQVGPRSLEHPALEILANACRYDDSCTRPFGSELRDQFGNSLRWSGENTEIGCCRQRGDRGIALLPLDRAIFRVDEPNGTRKAASPEVAGGNQANTARLRARAYESNRARLQQILEVANRHSVGLSKLVTATPIAALTRPNVSAGVPPASTAVHSAENGPGSNWSCP